MINNVSILIVDDEPSICKLISDILEPEGYTCETAASGEIALKLLSQHHFDLALLDIKIPGMSGMDLMDIMLKSRPSVPVMICTAVSDINIVIEALKRGAVDYILKPFTIDDIVNRVNAICRKNTAPPINNYQTLDSKTESSLDRLDAIARGVEAIIDHYDFHDRIVTERTIEVARSMDIPQSDIETWTAARQQRASSINKQVNLAADSYERSTDGTLTSIPSV